MARLSLRMVVSINQGPQYRPQKTNSSYLDPPEGTLIDGHPRPDAITYIIPVPFSFFGHLILHYWGKIPIYSPIPLCSPLAPLVTFFGVHLPWPWKALKRIYADDIKINLLRRLGLQRFSTYKSHLPEVRGTRN